MLRNGRMVNEGRITGGEGGMSMTPNSRGGNGGNGVVIMAGSNTPRLPGSALGLPDLVNRGQITGGNAANNSDYPSPYHSGTSGAGVVTQGQRLHRQLRHHHRGETVPAPTASRSG